MSEFKKDVFEPGKIKCEVNKNRVIDYIIIEYPKNYGDLANIVDEIKTEYSDYSDSAESIIDIAGKEYGVDFTLVFAELENNKIELELQRI